MTSRYLLDMIELTREQDAQKALEIGAWLDLLAGACNVLAMDAVVWIRLMHQSDTL